MTGFLEQRAARLQLASFLGMAALLPHSPGPYANVSELLIREGVNYAPSEDLPYLLYGRGAPGYCFYNAAQCALSGIPGDYVEGYAISWQGEPIHHAWIAYPGQFEAMDVTWPPQYLGRAYFGVRVPLPTLAAHWRNCGGASFLEDYYHDWPCLQVPYADWDPKLTERLTELLTTHCAVEVATGRAILRPDGSVFHREHLGNTAPKR